MAFFDYRCECGNEEEHVVSRRDLDTTQILCSLCGKTMKRLVSGGSFQISGQPPKAWSPLQKNNPKSEVRNIREVRRLE